MPANAKHLQGDFSDLLELPNPAQYQIYDPLTTRPDPANPSRMIRDPFPNNIIPRDRIFNPDGSYKNPLMALYSQMVPQPNQNFVENGQQPTGNFYQGGQPDSPKSHQYGFRRRLQRSREGSLLLPHQRHHVPRVRERLDLPSIRTRRCACIPPTARGISGRTPARGRATMGTTVIDTSVRHEPLQPGRQVPRPEAVQADRRRPAVLPRRVLLDQRRLHPARDRHRRLSGDRRRPRRTAIPPRTCRPSRRLTSVNGRAHAARRHRRAPRAARPHRRRQPLGPVDVRPHLHAAVQRRERR